MDIKQYNIIFRDRMERTVTIEISNTDIQTGEHKQLQAAASPLTISEDDDHDPMKPVRSTVAQIRVQCTHSELIRVTHNLQWRVSITRQGQAVWAGYLRTQMPDADYSPITSEVYYTADDIMGAWQYQRREMSGFANYLASILPATFTLMDNSMPIITRGMLPHSTLETLTANSQNWLNTEEDDEGMVQTVQPTAMDVASDIIEWLGMTARYYMGKLYLGTLFGTKFYDGSTPMELTPLDGSAFTWTGFHGIKVEQGKGHIRISAGGRQIEDASIPDIVGQDFSATSARYLPPQVTTDYDADAHNCFVRELTPNVNSGIELYVGIGGSPVNVFGRRGVHALDLDVWGDDRTKRNYSFSRGLLVVGVGLNGDNTTDPMPTYVVSDYTSLEDVYARSRVQMMAGLTQPLVTITSKAPIFAKDGGFTLKIMRRDMTIETATSAGLTYRRPTELGSDGDMSGTGVYVICSLRHANRYWNGLSWTDTPSKFLYMDGSTRVKTLDLMFTGGTAAMPVSGMYGGTVTFRIYGIYYNRQEQIDDGGRITYISRWFPEELTLLSGLDLAYQKALNLLDTGLPAAIVLNEATTGMPDEDEKSVTLHLTSKGSIKDNWGMVYNGNNVIETLHWPKLREDWAPERFVLRRNVLALSRLRSYATLSIECEYADLPFRRIQMDGRTWYPLAISTDMQACTSKLLMLDITDIMAELPEVGTDEESTGGEYNIYVEIVGQYVSLTMETALNVDVTVQWSTDSHSGTVIIPRGTLDAEFDAGGQIHDGREIGFAASTPEGDTFNFIYN